MKAKKRLMALLSKVRESNAWDSRYELPLLPILDNPWIYMAYLDVVLSIHGEPLKRTSIFTHFLNCEDAAKQKTPGMFARWPTGSQQTSHDEIMGAAYFMPAIAKSILAYLDTTGGEFNLNLEPSTPMQWNVYRFPWLRPYLLRCCRFGVNPIDQAIWSLHILVAAFSDKGPTNAGGRLRNWLMMQKMQGLPLCNVAIAIWRWRMRKSGETLAKSLAIEPKESPVLSELAALIPDAWPLEQKND